MQLCPTVHRAFFAANMLPDRALVLHIMCQVLHGVRHMHDSGYLHLE